MSSALVVERVGPGVTVQDRGRVGWMHHALPSGGPLDPSLFGHTHGPLGNRADAAAVEIPWHGAVFRAQGVVMVSVDGALRTLEDGDVLEVPAIDRAVRYVGVKGGVDVPIALGSRGTLAVASLGGLDGRMLRKGDVLPVGDAVGASREMSSYTVDFDAPIEVIVGPDDFDAASLAALASGVFTVTPRVDRVGMRLAGEGVTPPGDASGRSSPMVRGAIEVTPDGSLIVLGPDHPVTGGYPVIAVLATSAFGALAQRRPGASVRFSLRGA
jgi:5-oxoprolinase (ATP-hydrolysing) subunit C